MGKSLNKKLALIPLFFLANNSLAKDYKGAELYSKETVKYGRWEMRMMAAKGSGSLSTFFLYKEGSETGTVPWEEVDIEIKGKDNADYFQSNIITNYNGKDMSEQMHGPSGFGDRFHTFTLDWTSNKVEWKVDGQVVRTTQGKQVDALVSQMSYRFNFWAAYDANWVGAFDDNILPLYQYVNWIEYSSYTPAQGEEPEFFTFEWRDDFDALDNNRWGKATWSFDANRVDFDPDNINVQDGMLVLSLTKAGQTGFTGEVPADSVEVITSSVTTNQFNSAPKTPVVEWDGHRLNYLINGQRFNLKGEKFKD